MKKGFDWAAESPEELNEKEIREFYGWHGPLGKLKMLITFGLGYFLQLFARFAPHPALSVFFQRLRGVKIGKHVYIGQDVVIDEVYPSLVTIEDYASIGMETLIFAHTNPTCSIYLKKMYYPRKVAPVVIKKGAWVTPRCMILQGVTLGETSVVGIGSVVREDVKPNTLVAGLPAKEMKRLE